ncbi:hypothetical protein [Streptomyces mutabilis]|uniref:hypothetical protein n=1 Tax=Streptomyces mutabilis TaxID=67332 RepID=UPI0036945D55
MPTSPYRRLLAALETDWARQLEAARLAKHPETGLVASAMASGFLHAAALVVREFEGPHAAQEYAQRIVDGERQGAPPAV